MKKILVITHQLSRTGAPVVLLDMIRICKDQGYHIDVITMLDGELHEDLSAMHISVKVQEAFLPDAIGFLEYLKPFDMVIANTLVAYEAIHVLKFSRKPVLWWLHEGRQYFEYFKTVLPDFQSLPSNIHIFSVSHYVQQVVQDLYGYQTGILHLYVKDVLSDDKGISAGAKMRFLTAGTYSKIKGQDILVQSIRQISKHHHEKAEFVFCGSDQIYDDEVYRSVKCLADEYLNVTMVTAMPHTDFFRLMDDSVCLIVPSRVEGMPTVAVESMMKRKLCLCTNVCGIAHYIKDGINGFTVPPEDVRALKDKIEYIIDNDQNLDPIRKEGRKVFETYFSKDVIETQVLELLEAFI